MGVAGKNSKEMIVSLQALRAFGAILIFLHHSGLQGVVVTAFGDCAVNWFFMLSGFVLAAAYGFPAGGPQAASWREFRRLEARFVAGRFRRVAPLYYAAMLLMVVLTGFHPGIRATVWQALMLQSWVPDMDVFFGVNAPAWFISDIMLCYVLFLPLLLLRSARPRVFAALMVAGLAAYAAVLCLMPPGRGLYWVYVFPPMQVPSFVLGMLLWPVAARLRRAALRPLVADCMVAGAVVLVVAALLGYRHVPLCLQLSAWWWLPTAVLILALTATDGVRCAATAVLHFGPLVRLGNASYSFFILHLPWILGTRMALRMLHTELPPAAELPASIVLLALVSVAIHRGLRRS